VQGIKNNFHLMQLAGDRGWGLVQTRHHARLCKYAAGKCRGMQILKAKKTTPSVKA